MNTVLWTFVCSIIFTACVNVCSSEEWGSETCESVVRSENPQRGSGCVLDNSIADCETCVFDSQCESNWCYWGWKRCARSGKGCGFPFQAKCTANCPSSIDADFSLCECEHEDFPQKWVQCNNGSAGYDSYKAAADYVRKEDANGGLSASDKFAQFSTCYHSKMRQAGAGLNAVKWNSEMALFMKNHLQYLKTENDCKMEHSSDRNNIGGFSYVGENLFAVGTTYLPNQIPAIGKKQVQAWYSEIEDYVYGGEEAGPFSCPGVEFSKVGHFTQVMWYNLQEIGCDYLQCGNTFLTGCVYGPGGNGNWEAAFNDAAWCKLNSWSENEKYGGLKRCDDKNVNCEELI